MTTPLWASLKNVRAVNGDGFHSWMEERRGGAPRAAALSSFLVISDRWKHI